MKRLVTYSLPAVLASAGLAGGASAAITADGVLDADYGSALAVQTVGTQFGDDTADASALTSGGSEIDAIYANVSGGNLNIFVAGNLQTSFNPLEVFIDSVAGGQNTLAGDNPDVDFNGLNNMAGLTFDAGFESDYYLGTSGGDTGGQIEYFANFAPTDSSGGFGTFVGGSGADDTDIDAAESSNGILVSFNQSNVAGVGDFGAPFVSDPALVGTGIELIVPLTEIGSPTGDIRITAFINGNGHTFLSNQFGGPLPVGTGNLGDPGDVNLSLIDGDQFVTVPEPAGMALVGVGGLAMLGRRRE